MTSLLACNARLRPMRTCSGGATRRGYQKQWWTMASSSKSVFSLTQCTASKRQDDHEMIDAAEYSKKSGTLFGAIALITGSTVGAGMLALPSVTAPAGFLPTAAGLTGTWALLVCEALLMAEINIAIRNASPTTNDEMITLRHMAEHTLGRSGGRVVTLVYLALSYCLLVAYLAKAAEVIDFFTGHSIPTAGNATIFVGGITTLLLLGGSAAADKLNQWLTSALLVLFLGILTAGFAQNDVTTTVLHGHSSWTDIIPAIPILFLSLVYHDLVPLICSYLDGDKKKVWSALVLGSLIPFCMFLSWEAVALSLVPRGLTVADKMYYDDDGVGGGVSGGVGMIRNVALDDDTEMYYSYSRENGGGVSGVVVSSIGNEYGSEEMIENRAPLSSSKEGSSLATLLDATTRRTAPPLVSTKTASTMPSTMGTLSEIPPPSSAIAAATSSIPQTTFSSSSSASSSSSSASSSSSSASSSSSNVSSSIEQQQMHAKAVVDPLEVFVRQGDPITGTAVQIFSFLAVMTSFLGTVLGLSETLRTEVPGLMREAKRLMGMMEVHDALGMHGDESVTSSAPSTKIVDVVNAARTVIETDERAHAITTHFTISHEDPVRALALVLTLGPPLAFTAENPDAFLSVLSVAGGYGMTLLYGALPPLMAWNLRASRMNSVNDDTKNNARSVSITLPAAATASSTSVAFSNIASPNSTDDKTRKQESYRNNIFATLHGFVMQQAAPDAEALLPGGSPVLAGLLSIAVGIGLTRLASDLKMGGVLYDAVVQQYAGDAMDSAAASSILETSVSAVSAAVAPAVSLL